MERIAIVSDTHIPDREAWMPEEFEKRITQADHLIHAGDFISEEVLREIRELADGDLTAVKGNIDSGGLGLPEVSTLEVEDVKFVVTHGTGDLTNYQERVAETVKSNRADSDSVKTVGVSGHTHETLDTRVDGIRILNPGTVTGADPASEASMMTAEVDNGTIDVSLHIED